jgi:hypothetical protein
MVGFRVKLLVLIAIGEDRLDECPTPGAGLLANNQAEPRRSRHFTSQLT